MTKRNTITEVAKIAGVSVITASRAIRGVGYVAQATRDRVLQAAAQLNYTPDLLAQRMRGSSSMLIGVFIHGFGSSVVHELITSINRSARKLGYDLLAFNAEHFDAPGRASTSEMLRKLCDGLVLVLPNGSDTILDKLARAKSPCVLVNFSAREVDLPVIIGANRAGARIAIEHLIGLGHTRIAFIGGTPHTGQSADRQRGYEDALRAAGIPVDPAWLKEGDFMHPSGYRAARELFALPQRPTAIFAANDDMAFGVLDAAGEHGIAVPADLSVIGFDDVEAANYVFPRLTTLRQPLEEIGSRAVKELVAIIDGGPALPARVELPAQFIVRDSTAAAPR
ncbi:LacI family transcriptional regulator [Pseudoduganella lurida]|uniref:LacI family transcriptional regulator n=1 Tax=Pseudoduganella lurida TaxID=1036180 RepID=A0A562RL69_9BURK|nr:LacI family DNA-binding transcriptional regulator [Pseudoduganella lurida]TWI69797.1 LacI family transcriptional regulator [Pseudoduganella lurida]